MKDEFDLHRRIQFYKNYSHVFLSTKILDGFQLIRTQLIVFEILTIHHLLSNLGSGRAKKKKSIWNGLC